MFFQNTIIKKYTALLNEEQLHAAWQQYKSYFLNPAIQDNIRASKEEQFQEGFLRELFVKVFGYTLNPTPDYNLITEQKNETDAKKADGAILKDGKVIGVIELKDHKTTDLSHVERQAFGYKSQHRDTRYVVISNFEKLRFYIDNAVEHIEWNLFTLSEADFKQLYFCLSWGTLSQDLPLRAKTESVSSEDQITQQLYKDYSAFKREIFADIVAHNTDENTPKEQILLLFKKTQKLLDRLLFIFFAEDCGLLPPNSMIMILDDWQRLKEMDEYRPLYSRIKKYFGYLDTGFQGKKYEIFAYNGGLFKPDEVLDGLKITDDLLARFTRQLSEYDYASEVDVNILGHIFENSLNEIEEVTAQINAGETAPSVSKRKRDGVFYTPQYITKYIVENTVGRLCAEKKAEMGIDEAEYFADKNRQMATKKRLLDNLARYREWLLGITICDPACGSGAFLNAALQFLIAEHKLIDEMEVKVTGSAIEFPGVENSILENNLYGVDINEESVEIAKLALWLRTAKPHRKLNSLNNNIKCGNSLISDPEIAGDKAFDWQAEFPQVFAKGGFDVVIGNPPYVFARSSDAKSITSEDKEYYYKNYHLAQYQINLYHLFIERGHSLLKEDGYFAYIVPNNWMTINTNVELRKFILNQSNIKVVNFQKKVFDAAEVDSSIVLYKKSDEQHKIELLESPETENIVHIFSCETELIFKQKDYIINIDLYKNFENYNIVNHIEHASKELKDIATIKAGLQAYEVGKGTPVCTEEMKKERVYHSYNKEDDSYYPYLQGVDVRRYSLYWSGEYLKYGANLAAPRTFNLYSTPRILVRQIPSQPPYCINAVFEKDIYLNDRNSMNIVDIQVNPSYIIGVLNSRAISFWFVHKFGKLGRGLFPQFKINELSIFPIPNATQEQQDELATLANSMLALNKDLQEKRARFLRRLQDNMPEIKINGTLETFDTLDFAGFVTELKKQKIKLSLVQQDEWEDYFNQYRAACNVISAKIAATDKEIDTRVYALYGLTDEEIKIVEG